MASESQELKTLNKTVNEAVNILKIYVGTSAQVKSMAEKEREAVDKWLNVVDLAQEGEKRQRAFTERVRDEHGKFVKKQDQQTDKFIGMASSVGGMFKKAAVGIGSSIKNLTMGMMSHLRNFFSQLQNQFLSLFGEESEWFGILGSIKDSITGFAGSIISFIWQKTPRWAKDQIKILKDMYSLQIKQMKADFRDAYKGGKKDGPTGIMAIVAGIVLAIGAAIGAFMHRYFVLISKLPIFTKIANMFSKLDDIPIIGRLIKGIKFGFRYIGWPLTLILSLIDFIKAYQETEGSTWEKIKAGLWAAFNGLIEMPIRFITWAVEKILGWFGIDFDGKEAADKILGVIKTLFNLVIEGWEHIFRGLNIAYDWVAPKIKEWTNMLLDALNPIINWIIDFWNGIVDLAKSVISKVPGLSGEWLDKLKIGNREISETGQTAREKASQLEAEKAKINVEVTERMKQMQIEGRKIQEENKPFLNKIFSSWMNQQNNQTGGGDTKQIPDEVDYSFAGVFMHGHSMD